MKTNVISKRLIPDSISTGWSASLLAVLTLISFDPDVRAAEGGFVAHEWGTFTSVQGGDGVLLSWRPLESSKLPTFVHDWPHSGLNRAPDSFMAYGKGEMVARQRMETPVIYFYSDAPRTVDVTVDFPAGLVTEWYPEAARIGPAAVKPANEAIPLNLAASLDCSGRSRMFTTTGLKESRIGWTGVKILGARDTSVHQPLLDPSGSHYFAARETDASLLEVPSPASNLQAFEAEKFLFYRGVGNFATPLTVTMDAQGGLTVANRGAEPLTHLLVLAQGADAGKFATIESLAPGERRTVPIDAGVSQPLEPFAKQVGERMSEALAKEGLYPREAAAMVATWRDSWFAEQGVRVLYVLPRAWTDRTLPLTIRPAPREMARVMVGRAEVITPARERALAETLARANDGDARQRELALAELRRLGRFAEPALRLATRDGKAKFNQSAWKLFETARTVPGEVERKPL